MGGVGTATLQRLPVKTTEIRRNTTGLEINGSSGSKCYWVSVICYWHEKAVAKLSYHKILGTLALIMWYM